MKLFKVSQNINNNYDTFDSFVIACNSEDEARATDPYGECNTIKQDDTFASWVSADKVIVEYLGEAHNGLVKGIIVASFNAG